MSAWPHLLVRVRAMMAKGHLLDQYDKAQTEITRLCDEAEQTRVDLISARFRLRELADRLQAAGIPRPELQPRAQQPMPMRLP
jgi:hypothetical protein